MQPDLSLDQTVLTLVRREDDARFLAIQRAAFALRPALYAITAFHAELARIASLVSEPLIGHIRLAWWREALQEIAAGGVPRGHPVLQALAPLRQAHPAVLATLLPLMDARAERQGQCAHDGFKEPRILVSSFALQFDHRMRLFSARFREFYSGGDNKGREEEVRGERGREDCDFVCAGQRDLL